MNSQFRMMGSRSASVTGLKELRSPGEGGNCKEMDDFFLILGNHLAISWPGQDLTAEVVKTKEQPVIERPEKLSEDDAKDEDLVTCYDDAISEWGYKKRTVKDDLKALFSLVMAKVSKMLRSKIMSMDEYSAAEKTKNAIWLLKTIEDIMVNFDETKSNLIATDDQLKHILNIQQKRGETNEDFIRAVSREVKTFERHAGGFLWTPKRTDELDALVEEAKDAFKRKHKKGMTSDEEAGVRKSKALLVKERILANFILNHSDDGRYSELKKDMSNSFLTKNDRYPVTPSETMKVLDNWKPKDTPSRRSIDNTRSLSPNPRGNRNTSVSFFMSGNTKIKTLAGTNGSYFPRVTCHLCNMKGHYKSHCPCRTDDGERLDEENGGAAGQGDEVRVVFRAVLLLEQHGGAYINPRWILLDSESSHHMFCNSELVTGIRDTTDGEYLRAYSNGGHLDSRQKADFCSKIEVWFNVNSLANILSLALVTDQFRVTMDSDIENALIVYISERHTLHFKRVSENLYILNASNIDMSKLRSAFNFLSTVDQNKSMFKARDVRKADEANTLNRRTNHMAKDKFVRAVQNNLIRNCPVTVGDVKRSHLIYGPPLPGIKGRKRYEESPRVRDREIIQLPTELYEDLKNVTLCADFYFVNGVTVFHTISRRINYRTVTFPLSRSKQSIINEIKAVQQIYHSRGFRIVDLHGDNEFDKVEQDVLPIRLQCCGVDDHVPEVERSIQTQKNEHRSVCHAMPYKCLPRIMIREIIKQGNEFLNAVGNGDTIGDGLTSRNIIDNLPHVDYNDLKYEFGESVQLHVQERNSKTNTMKSRTIGAAVMGPRNLTGRYNFMSLESGSQIDGRVTARLPITDAVIRRVEELGEQQGQPFRASKLLHYEWRPGNPIGDEDAYVVEQAQAAQVVVPDPIMIPDPAPNPFNNAALQVVPAGADEIEQPQPGEAAEQQVEGVGNEPTAEPTRNEGAPTAENDRNEGARAPNQSANIRNEGAPEQRQNERNVGEATAPEEVDENVETGEENEENNEGFELETPQEGGVEPTTSITEDNGIVETEEQRNEERERRSSHFDVQTGEEYGRGKRNKRSTANNFHQSGQKQKEHDFLEKKFGDLSECEKLEYFLTARELMETTGSTHLMERFTTGLMFTSMSAKKGLEIYKEDAKIKLIAEFTHLIEYSVFHGVMADELTAKQKKAAGDMINLIEEKLNRGHTPDDPKLRARSVFNGKVQQGLYPKEETASPTVSLDGFMFVAINAAIEERAKASTDVKSAYLHARMKDIVHMRISGPEVDIFCELDPKLTKYVTYEKGKKVLYVQLDKALYGCVQSALLWYELYSTTLIDMGFELNPYDLCVANLTIDGTQCTICWYVDDNLITHKKMSVVEDVIAKIESKFGKMTVTKGDEHDFLGMNLKFKKGKLTISMKKHIVKAINDFEDEIVRNAATPAKGYLFDVREEAKKLGKRRAENFHSVTASLLFVSKRCRLDIQLAIGFLTTRISSPDEDDWMKLKRVLQYLRATIVLTLTIGGSTIRRMQSWVDVSYGVHDDCRSHTGGCASFGWGAVMTKCQKQKLNVKSSTEGEIVGVSDYLPNIIWGRMFIEAQGYPLIENILYQDNQGHLENFCRNSFFSTNSPPSAGQNHIFFLVCTLMGIFSVQHEWPDRPYSHYFDC